MNKLFKSTAIALLCITISTPLFNTSLAMENLEETKIIEETLRSEGFEQIDLSEIPEGVVPVVVNSEEDLLNQIKIFENEVAYLEEPLTLNNEQEVDTISPLATKAIQYKNFDVSKKSGTATHHVFGTLKISNGNIISVHNLKQDWTGWSIGTSYSNHPTEKITYSITNNKKTAKIRAPYKVNYYIVADGIGHVGSRYGYQFFYVNK